MFWKALLIVPLLVTAVTAQDCPPRKVKPPKPTATWPLYQKGVQWEESLEQAQALAKKEGKLVFYYHIVGDMDRAGC